MRSVRICSFEAVNVRKRGLNYDRLKAAVLEAGRFSVFEATETLKIARLYDRLVKDPELEIVNVGFPWSTVRRKP